MSALWAILTAFVLVLAWAWFVAQVQRGNQVHRSRAEYLALIVQARMAALLKPMQEFAASMRRLQIAFANLGPNVRTNVRKLERILAAEKARMDARIEGDG